MYDIRWSNASTGKKITYIETLQAEYERRNSWIYSYEWTKIELLLPTITEVEAEQECRTIRRKIGERVDYERQLYG